MSIIPNKETLILKEKLEENLKSLKNINNATGVWIPLSKKEIELLLHALSYLSR